MNDLVNPLPNAGQVPLVPGGHELPSPLSALIPLTSFAIDHCLKKLLQF